MHIESIVLNFMMLFICVELDARCVKLKGIQQAVNRVKNRLIAVILPNITSY